ncbi:unnamed protein product [Bemisia tabaci]|uniref:Uncharacterized protein n=1 Tax=Bemisia tabaci TaxID=7038 RepID=A0A9P0FAN8_BEMTA|nr:unnamed protein product [Bemisia tabaci]
MDQPEAKHTSIAQLITPKDEISGAVSSMKCMEYSLDTKPEVSHTVFINCEITESDPESGFDKEFTILASHPVKIEKDPLCQGSPSPDQPEICSYSFDAPAGFATELKSKVDNEEENLTNQLHTNFEIKDEISPQPDESEATFTQMNEEILTKNYIHAAPSHVPLVPFVRLKNIDDVPLYQSQVNLDVEAESKENEFNSVGSSMSPNREMYFE